MPRTIPDGDTNRIWTALGQIRNVIDNLKVYAASVQVSESLSPDDEHMLNVIKTKMDCAAKEVDEASTFMQDWIRGN